MADLTRSLAWWYHRLVGWVLPIGWWIWHHPYVVAAATVLLAVGLLTRRASRHHLLDGAGVIAWVAAVALGTVGLAPGYLPPIKPPQASLTTAGTHSPIILFRVHGVDHIPPTLNGDHVLGQASQYVDASSLSSGELLPLKRITPAVPDVNNGTLIPLHGVSIRATTPISGLMAADGPYSYGTEAPAPVIDSTGPHPVYAESFGIPGVGWRHRTHGGPTPISPPPASPGPVGSVGSWGSFNVGGGWPTSGAQSTHKPPPPLVGAHRLEAAAAKLAAPFHYQPDYGLMRADEAWIAAHMEYSRAPENTPHGWNPVAWVLFHTHHGWCAVTATAFAEIWAWQTDRTTAIATGYLVHPSGVVRIKDAHAWVQLVTLIHAPAGTSSPYAIDPTMVLHRVPPAPAPSPAVPLALVGVLALAVATPIWLHRRNPLRRLERRARHQLGRPRRPDEALGAYATAAGLDPTPAWRVWDAASRRR